MNRGLFVVISSPSGGGKDSVIRALLKVFPTSARLVTTTSRPPRPRQKNGIDYFFISPEEFKKRLDEGGFVEHNEYVGNFYGIEKKNLEKALENHDIVYTQIEVNGKNNLDKAGIEHLSIFLLPDSLDNLRVRIEKRGGLTPEQIDGRLEVAKREMEESGDYDYRIVNEQGKLDETVAKVARLIEEKAGLDKKS